MAWRGVGVRVAFCNVAADEVPTPSTAGHSSQTRQAEGRLPQGLFACTKHGPCMQVAFRCLGGGYPGLSGTGTLSSKHSCHRLLFFCCGYIVPCSPLLHPTLFNTFAQMIAVEDSPLHGVSEWTNLQRKKLSEGLRDLRKLFRAQRELWQENVSGSQQWLTLRDHSRSTLRVSEFLVSCL